MDLKYVRLFHEFVECIANVFFGLINPDPEPLGGASGVDLTFATRLAASPRSECQIQNSTSNLYLLVVL